MSVVTGYNSGKLPGVAARVDTRSAPVEWNPVLRTPSPAMQQGTPLPLSPGRVPTVSPASKTRPPITNKRKRAYRSIQWFQQDGASPHTSLESRLWLEDHFGDRLVSFKTPNIWSPHSHDLNPLDFFLWG